MTSKRLKNLGRLRLVLSVIALLLAGLMVFSGVMQYMAPGKASPPEEPTQPAQPTQSTQPTEPGQETIAPETTAPDITEVTEEPTVPVEQVIVGNGEGDEGSGQDNESGKSDQKPSGGSDKENSGSGNGNTGESDSDDGTNKADDSNDEKNNTPVGQNHSETISENESENASQDTTVDLNPIGGDEEATEESSEEEETTEPTEEEETTEPTEEMQTEPEETETIPVTEEEPVGTGNGTASEPLPEPVEKKPEGNIWGILFWTSGGLLVADLIAIMILSGRIRAEKEKLKKARAKIRGAAMAPAHPQTETIRRNAAPVAGTASAVAVGTVHQVGARSYQQDSLGHTAVLGDKGVLAVLADGMGGLSGGEKVSQKIVMNALALGNQLKPGQVNGVLWKMINQINEDVNRALGPDGLYKSGSTVLAVLSYGGQFQWISVGDSRIYLYRQGYASALNRDHDQLQAWMPEVLDGRRSMEETLRHPDGRKLTSFIGMGQLKHVDGSLSPIALEPGDRLVLMSDGIYSVISEDHLAAILKRYPDVNQAASAIEQVIREAKHPHQDNYTAIIMGF